LSGDYDAGFGIDMIRLAASSVNELGPAQIGAFETRDGTEDLDKLYDRMTSRLGPLAVVRSKFVNTHIPERAVKLEPVIARTQDDPEAKPDPDLARPLRLLPSPEPITVLAEVPDGPPASMVWRRVSYRFAKASGPERIEAEWWRTGQKLDLLGPSRTRPPEHDDNGKLRPPPYIPKLDAFESETLLRDYYVAEDYGGRRFWIYRQGLYGGETAPRWFLHGFFP
jgi:protein ImuB